MIRRDFLTRLAAGAAAASIGRGGDVFALAPQAHAGGPSPAAKLERISISTWSLHNYFPSTREKEFNLPGPMLALLDFPEMIVDKYKVHHFEFCTTHFASAEPSYLQEIRSRLVRTHSTVVNMPVDIEELWDQGGLSDPDKKKRDWAVKAYEKWIDVAHSLGVKSVRCDPGKMDAKNLERTAQSYRTLASYAEPKGVHVIIENHGGVGSEHPEELVKLFKLAGLGHVGALPDFGNFPDEATREKGLAMLFPYAHVVCHAKGLEIGADGVERKYDFPKAIEISKKAGFKGIYSIEYEGLGDPYVGVQRTLDELLKYL
jgi:sugar phosphate isomerase/epimerase